MYLDFFFAHKGYFLLYDNTYPISLCLCFNVLNFLHLELVQSNNSSSIDLIGFLLLNLLSSDVSNSSSNYYTFKFSGVTIFSFIANFITVWLPPSVALTESPMLHELNVSRYTLNSFPLLEELELLFELNPSFTELIRSVSINLCFTSNLFYRIFLKESFLRFIKLPLKLN